MGGGLTLRMIPKDAATEISKDEEDGAQRKAHPNRRLRFQN